MKRLLQNELLKLRYNRMSIVFAVLMVGCGAFTAVIPRFPGQITTFDYGVMASMRYLNEAGGLSAVLMTGIAAGLIAQEFNNKTIHNALSCGVSRRKYFLTKTCLYMASCFLVHLVTLLLYTFIRGAVFGFFPPYYRYRNLMIVTIVVHLGDAAVLFAYMSIFLLFAILFRNPAAVIFSGVAYYYLESWLPMIHGISFYGAPFYAIAGISPLVISGRVLSAEYAVLTLPCIATGIVFLSLAYLIFMKKDIN